ncbi:MAG: hypothetical protein ACPGRZ_16570 [Alphaproteobacteria bacterium]
MSLTDKGQELCQKLAEFNVAQGERLAGSDRDAKDVETTIEMLRRLEQGWSEYLRYGSI